MRTPRQRRSAEKVEAILAAARDLLARHDDAPLSTTTIAAHAGVAVSSLYRYFADVDEILDVLVAEHATAAAAAVEAALADDLAAGAAGGIADVYEIVLDAHLRLYASRPELTRTWANAALAERRREVELRTDCALVERVAAHLVARGMLPRATAIVRARMDAHWEAAGTLLGLVLRAERRRRPVLADDLRAMVRTLGGRLAPGDDGVDP